MSFLFLAALAAFESLCGPCHGPAGRGDGPAAHLYWPPPADLTGPLKLGGDRESLALTLSQGVPGTGMPAFAALPAERREPLLDYVVTLRGTGTLPAPAPTPVPVDLETLAERGATLWISTGCAACHEGRATLPGADLYDLATAPLKRGDAPPALFAAITGGRPGTPMPAFANVLNATDRWALVAFLRGRRRPDPHPAPRTSPAAMPRKGTTHPLWPSRPLAAQGDPPPGIVPALTDLASRRCARCHPVAYDAWMTSRHAQAAGPGVEGQRGPGATTACTACHAPLAEQSADPVLRAEGVGCAACHLRAHQKIGPPEPRHPLRSAPGMTARVEPGLLRGDFCLPCHSLGPAEAILGRPPLDTWREWAASPYFVAGVQCQHCHLPDAAHTFRGVHDPAAVRSGVGLTLRVAAGGVEATVRNVAIGHHFPTTATPRAVLRVRQLDAAARVLEGSERSWAIGRTLRREAGRWIEVADTRVPAGESVSWRYDVPLGPEAAQVEASLHMFPDWFYRGFFRGRLADRSLADLPREQLSRALAGAETSGFLVDFVRVPVSGSPASR